MEKLNELVEQAKEMAVLHGPVWSSALCESGCDGQAIKHHAIISDSKNDFVIDTGSDTNEASWLCDYLELCSPANILAIAEAFRALEQQRDALAAENSYLRPKAASELSNAWVLHKYWVGIQAALMHMQVGRTYEVEQWLRGTIAGPGIEAPNPKLTEEIDAWADKQNKDSISYFRALEIIKAETPATDTYLNSVRAEGVEMFAKEMGSPYGDCEDRDYETGFNRAIEVSKSKAAKFVTQLRAGKDGE